VHFVQAAEHNRLPSKACNLLKILSTLYINEHQCLVSLTKLSKCLDVVSITVSVLLEVNNGYDFDHNDWKYKRLSFICMPHKHTWPHINLEQEWATPLLEGHCPAEFTSNPNGLYARWYFGWRTKDAGLLPPIVESNVIQRIYIGFYTLWLY